MKDTQYGKLVHLKNPSEFFGLIDESIYAGKVVIFFFYLKKLKKLKKGYLSVTNVEFYAMYIVRLVQI
jgi:hypothetical protein